MLLKTKYARDNESEEMIDIILNSVSFDFGINAWQNVVGIPVVQKIYTSGDTNIASTLAGMENTVNGEIDALIKLLGK